MTGPASQAPASQPIDGQPTSDQSSTSQPPSDSFGPGPTDTAVQPTDQLPSGTPGPGDLPPLTAEDLNPPLEPLPEPILDNADDILTVMSDPDSIDQAVVSMLRLLGIGVYNADGSPLFVGAETSDADFFLSEPEVRGLVEMVRTGLDGQDWIPFSDFHAGVVAMGIDISEQDLASAYQEAYSENPDAAISRLAPYVGVEAPIPPFGVWLLLLDGFVPANGSSQPIASTGSVYLAQQTAPNVGLALKKIQQKVNSPAFQNALAQTAQSLHIIAMIGKAALSVTAVPYVAHEGHVDTGAPVTITATIRAQPVISPFSGQPVIAGCAGGTTAGVGVSWQYNGTVSSHGTTAIVNGATDGAGEAKLIFTPQHEKANGHGYELRTVGSVQATALGSELATKLYCASRAVGAFVAKSIVGTGNFVIGWHEPEAIHIKATLKDYSASFKLLGSGAETHGTDTFEGNLVQQDDGSWHGTVSATANGGWSGQSMLFLAGQSRCSSTWNATQQLEVFTQPTVSGQLLLQFFPLTAPRGSTGSGKCAYTRHKINGIYYAPYGDGAMMAPDQGQGLVIDLPPKPGGSRDYPYRVGLPGGGIISNTNWHVEIEYLEPPGP